MLWVCFNKANACKKEYKAENGNYYALPNTHSNPHYSSSLGNNGNYRYDQDYSTQYCEDSTKKLF